MIEISARIERRNAVRAALQNLPADLKEELQAQLEASAQEVVDMARRLVPVESGDLRNSIGWTYGKAPKGSVSLGEAGLSDIRIVIYAGNREAFYARWVEFGTVKNRARPFFFPSWRSLRRRIRGRLTRATTKAAKKAAERGMLA